MSELFVDTVKTQDGTKSISTTNVVDSYAGSAKVWLNMTGTGTIAINDSLNASSLSDINTGNFRVFYTSNMADVNYSMGVAGAATTAGTSANGKNIGSYTQFNLVNSAGISCFDTTGASYEDPTRAFIQNFGDLA